MWGNILTHIGVHHTSINFIPRMSSCADTRIARVDAESGCCADLTNLLIVPLLSMDDDDCDEQKCSSFAVVPTLTTVNST
jgi:hypothetical protein